MNHQNKKPLGYVDLPNGSKAIFPMNNLYLNFTFETSEHWESLRLIVNILIDAYKKIRPDTTAKTIEGNIEVRTQFQYILKDDGKTTRDQDIKMTEDDDEVTFIEFQNKAKTKKPLEMRAVEYFGLGISRSNGTVANQIWLLAENADTVLHGETFSRYVFKDEVNDRIHPSSSSIMYVSLPRLAQEKSPAGELASFLLGQSTTAESEAVNKVVESFNASFQVFKIDKEVAKMLTFEERARGEGFVEGEEIGVARGIPMGANKLAELIRSGLSLDDALRKINDEQLEFARAGN